MPAPPFDLSISELIWSSRYRLQEDGGESCIEKSWRRVAGALASVEAGRRSYWKERFYQALEDFRFIPGGRILAGAGSARNVTLFNCFVMGRIGNSLGSIFDNLKEGALTMQQGGGVGYDFSTLRPAGAGGSSPGPLACMKIWDSACEALLSTATRRGAMMATLRCDHPDIEAFVDAKRTPGLFRNFNLSVLVSDNFMGAVQEDQRWPLLYPAPELPDARRFPEQIRWRWSGTPLPCAVFRWIRARDLWEHIMRASYDTAEPGVLFIDHINRMNNLGYRERISATNPCGEIPLPPYGACDLGSINLTRFVREPFGRNARLDMEGIRNTTALAVRMLDNVISLSRFPLPNQRRQSQGSRRIGLGITGLADALIMLGLHYGTGEARDRAASVMEEICHAAYRASIELAAEKGSFPFLDSEAYLKRPFIRNLPPDIRRGIAADGIRNSHLIAIAPTGTISLLANNISSGIEPVFDLHYRRRIRTSGEEYREQELTDYALRLWQKMHPEEPLPAHFVTARQLSPHHHMLMQAALQPFVDNAISKTINVPQEVGFDAFRTIYEEAWRQGLKGCTTFRPNPVRGELLTSAGDLPCCH
ncbi:MAG TPA: adenosylcobalamin-dependent ribonucleoside-diphosphate reductase [Gammaproteobacteria bacterium]|nr:adenosylcobalamin-dependent ribonucleoside-diphosphate reductase [Gammaproteobacteria bacterium]